MHALTSFPLQTKRDYVDIREEVGNKDVPVAKGTFIDFDPVVILDIFKAVL